VTGDWPNELVRSFGYDLPGYFPDDANNIESLHSGSPDPFAVLGSLIGSPGHRPHVLGEGWFGTHHEVGIGRSEAENVWAIHTAYREGLGALVTGTVFDDLDADGIMDAGEGLPGITVTVRGVGSTVTNGGGGYSIEVPGGSHRITAEGPGFSGTSSGEFTVIGYNIGADFVSGAGAPVIRDYQLCGGREPTILGTDGDDVIYGTDGRDIIHGLGGDDVIYGLRGNDVICGGNGADVVRGGGGRDRIIGGSSDDTLRGGWRDDTLKGGWGEDTLVGGGGEDTCLAGERLTGCP
jgi:Ca2+-binding RTX toxin-like protein